MQKKVSNNNKISFLQNPVVTETIGAGKVEGVRVKDTLSGNTLDIKKDAVFVAIEHKPNTEIFVGQLDRTLESMMEAEPISRESLSLVTHMTINTDKL